MKYLRKKLLSQIALFIFVAACFTGCAIGRMDFSLLNPETVYSPLPSNAAVYLTTMGLDEETYDEIGFIHVSAASRAESYESLNKKLRKQAREVGADSVIYVTYGVENVFRLSLSLLVSPTMF